jgi:hypothetical protein
MTTQITICAGFFFEEKTPARTTMHNYYLTNERTLTSAIHQ